VRLPSTISAPRPSPDPTGLRRCRFAVILAAFLGLGLHVGVQAVLLADLAAARGLSPADLGVLVAAQATAGIVALLVGGRLADRFGRRPLLLLGSGGLGCFFVALTAVAPFPALAAVFAAGGVCASCYDLAVNALGGDFERRYRTRTMGLLHAGFSGGAAAGAAFAAVALAVGVGFRGVYVVAALPLLAMATAAGLLPLPPRSAPVAEGATSPAIDGAGPLLRVPGVALATKLVVVCFFGDGALEGFTSLYLRTLLGAGALLGGLGIAAFHLAGLVGRLLGNAAARRWGDRRVVTAAGGGAAGGMALALATTDPRLAVAGLLAVGLSLSPVVPTAFSLAGRAPPGRGAEAVSLVTVAGYGSFIAGPILVGGLATATSLRVALLPLVATSLGIALLGRRVTG